MTETTPSVLATSPPADDRPRTLKSNADFAVFDRNGDIRPAGLGEEGIYHRDVRYLSRLALTLDDARLLPLGSTIEADGLLFHADLTNPDLERDGVVSIPQDTIHIQRNSFLYDSSCRSRIKLRNYGGRNVAVTIRIRFEADFVDIFEVRGVSRTRRGEVADSQVYLPNRVDLKAVGLDGIARHTEVSFQPAPDELHEAEACFHLNLSPSETHDIFLLFQFDSDGATASQYQEAFVAARRCRHGADDAIVWSASDGADAWLKRSAADVNLMLTATEYGSYPYAGLPWFSSFFDRDGILTAFMYLWVNPRIARAVLMYLAAHQARHLDSRKDAEPGKILHEHREGEMATLEEVPFRSYYGSVDATPLFVILAEAYFQRTADVEFISSIWPNVQAALTWIDEYGDHDGDGLIEYERQSDNGIYHQGWKDSDDAISHEDGRLAKPPIALCEVQGYAFAARRAGARIAEKLADFEAADRLNCAADYLRNQFEESFWCEDLGTYALALDRDKSPCKVKTSNPGHCLFSGIVSENRAAELVPTLFSKASFSGWGIRTLAGDEVRFNPMSYHNGSVWPHDNAIIAYGLSRYRYRREVLQIMDGLFGVSSVHELHRMPELLCGFDRCHDTPPTRYPVACSPQAWSAASVFLLVQAALGMEIDAFEHRIRFVDPILPKWLPRLTIRNLRLNESRLDLAFERRPHDVGVQVLRCEGAPAVLIVEHELPGEEQW
ncbi:MAG: glycogen debranching N-terminal domain-containing protein [Pirellulaceae bacterium]